MPALARVHESKMIRTVRTVPDLVSGVLRGASIQSRRLVINDLPAFKGCLPTLAANVADFGEKSAPEPVKAMSAWVINQAAQQLGVKLNSPNALYTAVAEGKVTQKFAMPAVNIRANALDTARALFAAAIETNSVPILEIARSEIGYTNQKPREYAAVTQAAAILEGYKGPLFLQGDHIQLKAAEVRKGGESAEKERGAHSTLIMDLLAYGFGAIDIDMSPLEMRDKTELTHDEQQKPNYQATAAKVLEVRMLERGLGLPYTVLLGGETGEVGKKNTSPEDIAAYAAGLAQELARLQTETGLTLEGIRKIAVATGTSHGGVRLPDGSVAQVKIDFDVLEQAKQVAMQYGMAGPVQHGASTLPDSAFSLFVEKGAVEVHLATGFQDILFATAISQFPKLQGAMERFLVDKNLKDWKPETPFARFFAEARKNVTGPFKYETWTMPDEARGAAADALYAKFVFLLGALGVKDTREIVDQYVKDVDFQLPYPESAEVAMVEVKPESDSGSGLAD